jgi:hypothetical protein
MILRIIIIALLSVGFGIHSANADRMYTWTDGNGVIHITKEPPPPTKKADNIIQYKPKTEEQIRAVQKEAEKQQKRDDEIRKLDREKKPTPARAEKVEPSDSGGDYRYDGGGGLYTDRARRYERRKAIKEHLENNGPIKRPRQPRRTGRKR